MSRPSPGSWAKLAGVADLPAHNRTSWLFERSPDELSVMQSQRGRHAEVDCAVLRLRAKPELHEQPLSSFVRVRGRHHVGPAVVVLATTPRIAHRPQTGDQARKTPVHAGLLAVGPQMDLTMPGRDEPAVNLATERTQRIRPEHDVLVGAVAAQSSFGKWCDLWMSAGEGPLIVDKGCRAIAVVG